MRDTPTLPEPSLIERYEAADRPLAITGLAPLGHDAKHNRITLKNVVQGVVKALEQATEDVAPDLVRELDDAALAVQPVQRPASWCVFTDGTEWEALLLPEPFIHLVMDDTRYYVRPLIQSAASHGEFVLLALSQGDVRLYRITGEHMRPIHLDDLPRSLTEVVGSEVDGGTLQHHLNTPAGGQYHGQGKGRDDLDAEIARFLRSVDQAITDDLRLRADHLMIAAVSELAAAFRHHSRHEHLLEAQVELSPDQTPEEDLRLAALDTFEQWQQRDAGAFLEGLKERHDLALWQADEVIRAAEEGRVETLVVVEDQFLWGRFDPESWQVETHDERRGDSRDLVDTAMRATWRQGGRIRVVKQDTAAAATMPGPLAAQLRY